jgi:hypothetical protein
MTNALHLPADPDAPIACDMSSAEDTPDERLQEYGRYFAQSLLRRERRADSVLFSFRADPGAAEGLKDLARREWACCPFLAYCVEPAGDEVRWTTTNAVAGDARAAVDAFLDVFYALPDHAGSDIAGLFDRLADQDVHVIERGERFELAD